MARADAAEKQRGTDEVIPHASSSCVCEGNRQDLKIMCKTAPVGPAPRARQHPEQHSVCIANKCELTSTNTQHFGTIRLIRVTDMFNSRSLSRCCFPEYVTPKYLKYIVSIIVNVNINTKTSPPELWLITRHGGLHELMQDPVWANKFRGN